MSKKKKNQIGKIFTITGLLLFAAALALSAYNLWDGYRAEQSREKLLEEYSDKNQNISDEGEQAEKSDGQIPDYQLNPEMEMPATPASVCARPAKSSSLFPVRVWLAQ